MTKKTEFVNLAHLIEIDANNRQKTYFKKACGISRHAWNWGLGRWNELYEIKKSLPREERSSIVISGKALKKEYNSLKKQKFPWAYEVTKYASQQPFIHLQLAWDRFFSPEIKSDKPNFKKKNKSVDSFYIGGDHVKLKGKRLWIPNLGFIRIKENLRFNGKINSVTISRKADRWFASIQVKVDRSSIKKTHSSKKVGVDLGVNKAVFLSDGTSIESPKPLKRNLKKLAREQRKLSRKIEAAKRDGVKLSERKNFQKQKLEVQRLHLKIGNIRKDSTHKITNYITNNFKEIAIEDLHVKGMLKNQKLSRAISDIGFGEIRRQLEYKAKLRGCEVYVVDRFYPSSKTCSSCGEVKEKGELKLGDRVFKCECGFEIDRDLNAAINLRNQINLAKKIRIVRPKFKPVETVAMRKSVFPMIVTSVNEVGSKLQAA